MKKFLTLAMAALIFSMGAFAQNLVPNPGFEAYDFCPSSIGFFTSNVQGWDCPLNFSSPDYFNTCTNSLESGVPLNNFGYQWAHNGNGMAGIIAWEGTYSNGTYLHPYSEQLEVKLDQKLVAGKYYCVTFFVNSAINQTSSQQKKTYISLDEIGVNFSQQKISIGSGATIKLPYHVKNVPGRYITDTTGWTKVSAMYKAAGNEEWMVLGVFTDETNPPTFTKVDPASVASLHHSYMYIDDVSVEMVKLNDTVFTTYDTTFCNKGILPMDLKAKHRDGIYNWSTGSLDEVLKVKEEGIYTCTTYTDCKWYIDTFRVKYDPKGELSLEKEAINCNNGAVVLKPQTTFKNYLWSTGATSDSIIVTEPGRYYLKATGDCGTRVDTVNVYIQPPTPEPLASDTMLCELTAEPALLVKGEKLTWYTAKEGSIGSPTQPSVNTMVLGTRTFYVTQTKGKCESNKVPLTIYVKYTPKKIMEPISEMCEKNRDTLGQQLPDVRFSWSNGYNSCCIVPDRSGKYFLTMSNDCGTYVDTANVHFYICDTCVAMPNAFTPNSDGRNDEFKPVLTCPVGRFYMRIYNRWGGIAFETTDVNKGWDGTMNGVRQDIGTYIYLIEYSPASTGRPKIAQGNLLLLR